MQKEVVQTRNFRSRPLFCGLDKVQTTLLWSGYSGSDREKLALFKLIKKLVPSGPDHFCWFTPRKPGPSLVRSSRAFPGCRRSNLHLNRKVTASTSTMPDVRSVCRIFNLVLRALALRCFMLDASHTSSSVVQLFYKADEGGTNSTNTLYTYTPFNRTIQTQVGASCESKTPLGIGRTRTAASIEHVSRCGALTNSPTSRRHAVAASSISTSRPTCALPCLRCTQSYACMH